MYSFHSSPDEKNKLLSTLAQHGIETTVDRSAKKQRIRDWIQSSVITEEEEVVSNEKNKIQRRSSFISKNVFQEDDSGTTTPSSTHSRTPIAGHVSSLRSPAEDAARKITSNIKDSANKHIDPRTGNIEQGPSRMGFDSSQNVPAKESSPVESTSRNAYTTSRTDNSTNHSFKGKRETITNSHNSLSSNRNQTEASGSARQLMYNGNSNGLHSHPIIMDSGYGSLDKLKMDGNGQMRSPVLTRRLSNKMAKQTGKSDGNSFDSDDRASDEAESSGFVNTIGVPLSMKDTAYDHVRIKK